jgi:hypothetical protein
MVKAGSKWHVIIMRPGGSPISNLATALREGGLYDAEEEDILAWVKTTLLRSGLGLAEAVRQSQLPTGTNLLLVVDQFEEIFRYWREGNADEAEAFVALLLASAKQTAVPIYVIITMRSDFLGNCTLFRELPEALNEGLFLTPRLTREQCAEAIVGPARLFSGEIEPPLVNRLLNDFGTDPDQLPLLQHALMRMSIGRRIVKMRNRSIWSITRPLAEWQKPSLVTQMRPILNCRPIVPGKLPKNCSKLSQKRALIIVASAGRLGWAIYWTSWRPGKNNCSLSSNVFGKPVARS